MASRQRYRIYFLFELGNSDDVFRIFFERGFSVNHDYFFSVYSKRFNRIALVRRNVQNYFIAVIKSLLGRSERSAFAGTYRNRQLFFFAHNRNNRVGRNIFKRKRIVFKIIFYLTDVCRRCLVTFFWHSRNHNFTAGRNFATRQRYFFYSVIAERLYGIFRAVYFGRNNRIAVNCYFVYVFVFFGNLFPVYFKRQEFSARGELYGNYRLFSEYGTRFICGDRSERLVHGDAVNNSRKLYLKLMVGVRRNASVVPLQTRGFIKFDFIPVKRHI